MFNYGCRKASMAFQVVTEFCMARGWGRVLEYGAYSRVEGAVTRVHISVSRSTNVDRRWNFGDMMPGFDVFYFRSPDNPEVEVQLLQQLWFGKKESWNSWNVSPEGEISFQALPSRPAALQ